jgi:hypothetical protein
MAKQLEQDNHEAGNRIDYLGLDGYRYVKIDGQEYRADHFAHFYMTGEWPKHEIVHRDGNRANNAWDNIRPDEII